MRITLAAVCGAALLGSWAAALAPTEVDNHVAISGDVWATRWYQQPGDVPQERRWQFEFVVDGHPGNAAVLPQLPTVIEERGGSTPGTSSLILEIRHYVNGKEVYPAIIGHDLSSESAEGTARTDWTIPAMWDGSVRQGFLVRGNNVVETLLRVRHDVSAHGTGIIDFSAGPQTIQLREDAGNARWIMPAIVTAVAGTVAGVALLYHPRRPVG